MTHRFFPDDPKARHRLLGICLAGLVVTAGSLIAAGFLFRSHDSRAAPRNSGAQADKAERPKPVAVGLGMADVEGGVLSLYPTVGGRVTEVPVAENDKVRAGAVLLR